MRRWWWVVVVVAIGAAAIFAFQISRRVERKDELSAAMSGAVPTNARMIVPAGFDAGASGASGSCEFEADTSWAGYSTWLTSSLHDWQIVSQTVTGYQFRRTSPTDSYSLTVERTGELPLRVRVVVTGAPF